MIFRLIEVPSQESSIATDPSAAAKMTGARLAALELAVVRYSRRTPPVVVSRIYVSYLPVMLVRAVSATER
jgi:hypothetical protein